MCPNCTDMRYLLLSSLLALGLAVSAQIPDYVPTDGLVAWLSFNNGVLDQGPLNNTSTDFGSAGTFDRFGLPDAARNFDAARVELANSDVIDQFKTVSQWTRTESSSRQVSFKQNVFNGALQERVVITQNFNGDNCHFGIKESCGGSWNYGNQPFIVSDGAWHHFVGVILPEETRLYVDGVLISTTSIVSDTETCNGGDIIIGSEWSGVDYNFQGDIDDVGLWDRPLDEEEILGLYLADAPISGCTEEDACNFDPDAALDDGSCHFNCQFCDDGTVWDEDVFKCVVANPSDTDFDGCVSMTDLLDLLSVFGTCNEVPWSCGDPLEYQGYDYETVQIGEQCWFAENLRAHQFRNGDIIPSGLSDGQWTAAESPAMAWYGEASTSCENFVPEFDACDGVPSDYNFGGLYNGYVVTDARPVCPSGWSTPSMSDFYTLLDNYADPFQAADALKAQSTWSGEDSNGSNLSGFKAFASGFRRGLGTSISEPGFYDRAGVYGNFWADDFTNEESFLVYGMSLTPQIGVELLDGIQWSPAPGGFGFSVRCVQDAE